MGRWIFEPVRFCVLIFNMKFVATSLKNLTCHGFVSYVSIRLMVVNGMINCAHFLNLKGQ